MKVLVFLLKSGLEIVGEAGMNEEGTAWFVHRPFMVHRATVVQQTPQGLAINTLPQIVPLIAAGMESSVLILADDLIGNPMEPTQVTLEQYTRHTTGIQLARPGKH